MSTIKVTNIDPPSTGGAVNVNGVAMPNAGPLSNRNLIINGAMQVAQRGTSETGVTSTGYTVVDRMRVILSSLGTHTIEQSSDAPTGFGSSFKLSCTTANASPSASSALWLLTKLEGQNLQTLKKGTADAEQVTLSFWVKCNKTGNMRVNLTDNDNGRTIGSTVTISSADTWEYKTITYAGDTTGTLDNDNGNSFQVEFWFDAGTNYTSGAVPTSWEAQDQTDRNAGGTLSLGDSTSNYINITGVQLEVGSVATPFEHRSYGDELARCQRYYGRIRLANQEWIYNEGNAADSKWHQAYVPFSMRTQPSIDVSDLSTGVSVNGLSGTVSSIAAQAPGDTPSRISTRVTMSTASGTGRNMYHIDGWNGDYIAVSAEL